MMEHDETGALYTDYVCRTSWIAPSSSSRSNGLGNYWRVAHEFLLLGVRGNCSFLDQLHMSWIKAEQEEYSIVVDTIEGTNA